MGKMQVGKELWIVSRSRMGLMRLWERAFQAAHRGHHARHCDGKKSGYALGTSVGEYLFAGGGQDGDRVSGR